MIVHDFNTNLIQNPKERRQELKRNGGCTVNPEKTVEANYGLKNKNEAINLMAEQYEERILELKLRPKYVEKMKKRQKEPTIKIEDFKEHFGLE